MDVRRLQRVNEHLTFTWNTVFRKRNVVATAAQESPPHRLTLDVRYTYDRGNISIQFKNFL
jgi:hypothetical protein